MFFEISEKKYFVGACRYFETNQNQLAIYHIFFYFNKEQLRPFIIVIHCNCKFI